MSDLLEKIAPVQGYTPGIPWSMHLEAYDAYSKRWAPQPALIDLEGRNCRGGFSTGELDQFIPGWRERVSEIAKLKAKVAALEGELATAKAGAACGLPPAGWHCTREHGHDGPCAAHPLNLQDSEQYIGQMAAISTASLGYWSEGDGILPEYDTVPLRDVARLYAKYALLHSKSHQLRPIYTCKGKGGQYELLGVAAGAGVSRGTQTVVYRDTATGALYFRTPDEFDDRMVESTDTTAATTRADILAMAEQRFGWAYGLGGFPHAIAAFAADLVDRLKLRSATTGPVDEPLDPIEGDLLPAVGSKVLIHLGRQNAWIEHTVAGYYVWPAMSHQIKEGEKNAHRVFVRVKDARGYDNSRLLSEVRVVT